MTPAELASGALRSIVSAAASPSGAGDDAAVDGDGGGTLLFVLVPLLVGVLFGVVARRPAFGGQVTAVGVVGFAIVYHLATSGTVLQSGDGGSFDDLADALLTVIVFASLLLAFGLVGLVGLGALGGSLLRALVSGPPVAAGTGDAEPPDPTPGRPDGDPGRPDRPVDARRRADP